MSYLKLLFPFGLLYFSNLLLLLRGDGLSFLEFFYSSLACAFLIFLILYQQVIDKIAPLDLIETKNTHKSSADFERYLLAFSPVFFPLSSFFPFTIFGIVLLVRIREILILIQRIMDKYGNNSSLLYHKLDKLSRLRPQIAVHLSGFETAGYQINQWLPVLEQLNLSVIIIVRKKSILSGIHPTSLPIVYVRNHQWLEHVLSIESMRTVLYPANPMENAQAFRQYRLNHFFINHGESDKAVNQSKLLQAYDKLLVSGPLALERLQTAGLALRADQVEIVGRPQAEMLLDKQGEACGNNLTVLYAPTWEGFGEDVDYSSIQNLGMDILKGLVDDPRVNKAIFRPHPYTGMRNSQVRQVLKDMLLFCKSQKITVHGMDTPIFESMNVSDVLLCDLSSVIGDYLATDKPIILAMNDNVSETIEKGEAVSAESAYKLSEGTQLAELIVDICTVDSMQIERKNIRSRVLGDIPEGSFNRFKAIINESVQ